MFESVEMYPGNTVIFQPKAECMLCGQFRLMTESEVDRFG